MNITHVVYQGDLIEVIFNDSGILEVTLYPDNQLVIGQQLDPSRLPAQLRQLIEDSINDS